MSSSDAIVRAAVLALLLLGGCAQILGLGDPELDEGPPTARLSALSLDGELLQPAFDPLVTEYTVGMPFFEVQTIVTAAADATSAIEIDGASAVSGTPSAPIALELGENVIEIRVSAPGFADGIYTIAVARGKDVIDYIKASNTDAADRFGEGVALDGDTLVIGAPGEAGAAIGIDGNQDDNSAAGAGAVYVFVRSGATWSQQAYIKASNTDADDSFGQTVALAGETLVVGAPREAGTAGAAYVFTRVGSVWSQQALLEASNAEVGDTFGQGLAISGDTIAVGARGEASQATGIDGDQLSNDAVAAGAAYVFTRSGTTWTQQAYIKASNTAVVDFFGHSVALDGDTLAVGAFGEDSMATGINGDETSNSRSGAGAVYIFTRLAGVWSQQAYIKASNTGAGDSFGVSLGLDGSTLAVGATGEASSAIAIGGDETSDAAPFSGSVYVFTRTGTTWSQQAYVKASNTDANDGFGASVRLVGDSMAVAAPGEESDDSGIDGDQGDNTSRRGAVYVLRRVAGVWSQRAYVKASNTDTDDNFGVGVGLSGDTLVVSANQEDGADVGVNGNQADNSADAAGAVYVYE